MNSDIEISILLNGTTGGRLTIETYVNAGHNRAFDVVRVNGFDMFLNRKQTRQLRDELTAFLEANETAQGGPNA
jgi:hypothetical protein